VTGVFAFATRQQGHQDRTTLTLATVLPTDHPVNQALFRMAKIVKKESGGTLAIDVVPNGTLGTESDYIENMQAGALDMGKVSATTLASFVPQMKVFGLPYLFKSEAQYWRVLNGKIGKQLLLAGKSTGVRGLCYFDAGSRNFYTINTPILKPSDLDGLKIRVMKSQVSMNMVSALGGSPTPVAWGELFSDLQQGVVDGAENNPPSFVSNHQDEVCKQFSFDRHTRVPDVLLISTKTWNSLSDRDKTIINQAVKQASQYERKLWKQRTQKAVATMKKDGVKVHYPDRKPFMQKTEAMRQRYAKTSIGPLMKEIEAVK